MADKFVIYEPNDPPETGHRETDAHATTAAKALDVAESLLDEYPPGQSILVIRHDKDGPTNEVWSVQTNPEGNNDVVAYEADTGEPYVDRRPVDGVLVRVVHDPTEEAFDLDEDEKIVNRRLEGKPTIADVVEDEEVSA